MKIKVNNQSRAFAAHPGSAANENTAGMLVLAWHDHFYRQARQERQENKSFALSAAFAVQFTGF